MVFLFRVRIPVNCKNFKLFFADDDINSGDHTEPWWSVDTLPPWFYVKILKIFDSQVVSGYSGYTPSKKCLWKKNVWFRALKAWK